VRPASLGGRQRRGGQYRFGGVVVIARPLIPVFDVRLVFYLIVTKSPGIRRISDEIDRTGSPC
jgi:hypothetical protein